MARYKSSESTLGKFPSKEFCDRNLIFLIALPRSGSTLLQRILSAHQDICTTTEPWLMLHPLHALKPDEVRTKYEHALAIGALRDFLKHFPEGEDLYYKSARAYGLTFYSRIVEISGKSLFLDKTPRYYTIIPELKRTFPNARFIILLRNPMAVLSSVLQTWCRNDPARLIRSANYRDMTDGPRMIVEGINYLKDKAAIVSYEELITTPSKTVQKLCDFLEIDFSKEMIRYGSHSAPQGRYGDQNNVHLYDRPVKHSLNKWNANLSKPNLTKFARSYLKSVDPKIIKNMGYDFDEINGVLNSLKSEQSLDKKNNSRDDMSVLEVRHHSGQNSILTAYDSLAAKISDMAPSAAVDKILKFLTRYPNTAIAYNDLGVLHYRLQKKKEALDFYGKASALEPTNTVFQKNLADHLYFSMGKDEEALAVYVRILQNNPSDAETLLCLAHICIKNDRLKDARDFCHQVLLAHPENRGARQLLSEIETKTDVTTSADTVSKDKILFPIGNKVVRSVDSITASLNGSLESLTSCGAEFSPVIIYQMGKVGSTSVMNSLNRIGIPNQHIHRLSWQGIQQAEERYRLSGTTQIPQRIRRYRAFREFIENRRHDTRWKIITMVRDPLSRLISCIFQNLDFIIPKVLKLKNAAEQIKLIENHIGKYLRDFNESDDDACSWFDTELKDVFGFDIFSTPFNKQRGYTIYRTNNADILALRIEQLSICAGEAFSEFLTIDNFPLATANTISEKPYYSLYKQFLSKFIIPEDQLNRFYNTRLAKHFYTSKEIVGFKARWIQQTKHERLTISEHNFRVSAVVSTYRSKRFIEGRLQNLVEQSVFQKGQLEIIVVDSNSPENERAIVERFSEKYPHIVYLRTQERETVYAAWNRGIENARGTYFVNANTDDRFAPNALEVMADTLDAQPEYDAVYGNWVVTRTPNDTFESSMSKHLFVYPEFHPGLFFYLQVTSHANFVRRSVFKQIGAFDDSYTVFGDREFMLRFSAKGFKALKLERTIGLYLENPTSVERANKDIGMQECSVLYDHYLAPDRFARLMGRGTAMTLKALSKAYTEVGCFGMGLYYIDGKSIHALGSPVKLFAKAIELDTENVEALNNMGVVAQYHRATQDTPHFLNNARSLANNEQIRVVDHNQKLSRRGISDPDQLQFLFPADFKSIKVIKTEFNSGFGNGPIAAINPSGLKPKKNAKRKTSKKTRKKNKKSTSKLKKGVFPLRQAELLSENNVIEPSWAHYLREDFPSALMSLQKAIAAQPDHWEAYRLLYDVMLQSGQEAGIPEQLRPLENRSDVPAWVLALVGSGYEAAGDLSGADRLAGQALEKDVNCSHGWNLKGVIEYRNGNPEAAIRHFQKASDCDSSWGDPWTNWGTIHWEQGATDTALDYFEKGFSLSPTAPNVATTYHIAISETAQYERAKPFFEKVVKRHPDFLKARFLLIDILIRLEAYLAALDQIESVMVRFGAEPQLLEAAKDIRGKVGPMTIKKGQHPSLSLCMIVKNEEKYIARCLESLKPIVDEMIVVDTGSSDVTRDIVEVFGAKVFDFEWNDDFSAARNFSLKQASGDWILVMDADEVIASSDHKTFRSLIRKHNNGRAAFSIVTRNYT
ncbi:MAG: glycosyltransferase, partial [Desulfosarcina sp.]|nr:glycosyltransferase [Desulfobacterales bacterium]